MVKSASLLSGPISGLIASQMFLYSRLFNLGEACGVLEEAQTNQIRVAQ